MTMVLSVKDRSIEADKEKEAVLKFGRRPGEKVVVVVVVVSGKGCGCFGGVSGSRPVGTVNTEISTVSRKQRL